MALADVFQFPFGCGGVACRPSCIVFFVGHFIFRSDAREKYFRFGNIVIIFVQ
jgi:hypothetical protein